MLTLKYIVGVIGLATLHLAEAAPQGMGTGNMKYPPSLNPAVFNSSKATIDHPWGWTADKYVAPAKHAANTSWYEWGPPAEKPKYGPSWDETWSWKPEEQSWNNKPKDEKSSEGTPAQKPKPTQTPATKFNNEESTDIESSKPSSTKAANSWFGFLNGGQGWQGDTTASEERKAKEDEENKIKAEHEKNDKERARLKKEDEDRNSPVQGQAKPQPQSNPGQNRQSPNDRAPVGQKPQDAGKKNHKRAGFMVECGSAWPEKYGPGPRYLVVDSARDLWTMSRIDPKFLVANQIPEMALCWKPPNDRPTVMTSGTKHALASFADLAFTTDQILNNCPGDEIAGHAVLYDDAGWKFEIHVGSF